MKNVLLKILLPFIFLSTTTSPALAGDFAERKIIGFSKDGSKFAFEEYGVQDGSGFPYSNIYIIDTKTDQWINGSPWRVRLDLETASIKDARFKNSKLAHNALKDITENGFIAASNRYTEILDNPYKIKAHTRSYIPSGAEPVEFNIQLLDVASKADCKHLGDVKGFKLSQNFSNGQSQRTLHEDKSIPKSRGCPLDYTFSDIITYYPANETPIAAILILKTSFGFEGPDGRFLAVTTPIE